MEIICKLWTENLEINGYTIEDILSLIKEAYGERAKEGISFATLNYSVDDLLAERSSADYWFLAFDEDNHLYGTARLTVKDKSGEICNFAVLPKSQGKHVGSQLLRAANHFAKEQELDYVISYTAIKAASSVRCHCNNGFQIVGINIGLHQDYSSYVFRNQIAPSSYWNNDLLVRLGFLKSYIEYRVAKKANGQNTMLGNLFLYIKEKIIR